MSFNSNQPRVEHVATDGQTVFDFLFKIYVTSDITVYVTAAGGTTPVLLSETIDYTVTINGDAGGEITLVSGAETNETITLIRRLPVTRSIEYQTGGDLLADVLNADQEYQTYLIADGMDALGAIESGDFSPSTFVLKSGDSMLGYLTVLANASGSQAIRADETVRVMDAQTIAGVKTFTSSPIVPTATEDTQAVNKLQMNNAITAVADEIMIVQEVKSIGIDAGTFTAGSWVKRSINTIQNNDISGASLVANQITLPPGKYKISGLTPAYEVGGNQSRIYNVTDASLLLTGGSMKTSSGVQSVGAVIGVIVLSVETKIELQHRCANTNSGDGLGLASSFGDEIYAQMQITKIG